ncbi:MAG: M20/M25/M40 family metallo-hydrolase [Verrucomicrobia bacterium]|nr:M20/M25/M40 family metallo-hydrolase [Verrucomicrobiota bacterium]
MNRHIRWAAAARWAMVILGCVAGVRAAESDLAVLKSQIAKQHDVAVKRLQDWIRQPAIAAENRGFPEGADYMAKLLREVGFQRAEVVPTKGKPGVFATLDAGAAKWVGVYFMYDVKQFDPKEWSSPPLDAALVDRPGLGKVIVGRGAVNQKGPQSALLAAIDAFRAAGKKLPVNLVVVAEGEEEIGSPNISDLALRPDVKAALAKTVGVFMPSASQDLEGNVTVSLGAKGVIECELTASGLAWGRGPTTDVHSSLKAMVDSPAWRLVAALNTLVSPDGNTPMIDGFAAKARPLSADEKAMIAAAAKRRNEVQMKRPLGVKVWIDDLPFQQALERLESQPTVNIEGLVGGYTGPGGKTVLPHKAVAKLDLRLVPDMTAKEALAALKAHLAKRSFGDIDVNMTGGYDPTQTPASAPLIQAQMTVLKRAGVDPILWPRNAGSYPGYIFTQAPLALPSGHFGLGHGGGAHAPNEFYLIESTNPRLAGLDGAAMSFVEYLFELAK